MKKILYIAIAIFYLYMPEPVNANRFETSANNIVFAVPESQKFSVAQVGDALSSDGAQRAVTEGDPAGRNFVATMVIGSFQKDVAYTQYQYADGLGNTVETVCQGFTPQGNDLVSFQEYDPATRRAVSWLPAPARQANGAYVGLSEVKSFSSGYYADSKAYTTVVADLFNRTNVQIKPGEAIVAAGVVCKYDYGVNTAADEVRKIVIGTKNDSFYMDITGVYPAYSLDVVTITNEDGRVSKTYTDKAGRVVMSSSGNARTYYGYDALGRLTVVVTPQGATGFASLSKLNVQALSDDESQQIGTPTIADPANIGMRSAFVQNFCYYYRYNDQGQLIERKFPGAVREELEYNKRGQLTTRFRGKVTNDKTLEYADRYLYDGLGRLYAVKFAIYSLDAQGNRGMLPSNPITMIDYKFDSYEAVPAELAYKSEPIGNMSAGVDRTAVKGLKTYEKIRVLTERDRTAGYIERAYYYDMLGRVLQVVEKNYLGGISYFTTAYDLQGNLTFRRERVVPKTGCAEDLLTVEYTYDNAGRMLTQTSTFNTSKPVTVTYSYNEIGQLVRKNINGLIEDYTYNVQGWLTSQDSPYYSARLKYYDSENPSYTGNITEWNWGGAGTMPHTYKYEYDALSRLTEARYSGDMGTDRYSERGIKYDRNGNILKMTRGLNEQLEYKYNDAGQLYGINQASVVYDNLGNLVRDFRNGLTIAYNFLNLPMQIKSSADNFELNYCYRADGGKFSALDADKTGLVYIGSLVYKQTAGSKIEFESAAFSDGRFRKSIHSWVPDYAPEYYLKDHLGSPRAFVDWSGELIALRDYYAFGKSWLKPNSPATSDLSRFNGKEEQTVGDAGLLDFGARFYHPDLGRWLTQDPLAQQYAGVSPYNFCLNNPIRYTDPFGLEPQQGRQIGVRDYYFSEYGMYLGRDDAITNNVRIIAFSRWLSLKKDLFGRVNQYEARIKSVLFSYATIIDVPNASYSGPMPDFAILNVYKWVCDNFILISLNSQNLWINNSLSKGELARINVDYKNGTLSYDVGINHNYMAEKGYCDNIYNIASVLSHETGHKEAYTVDPIGEHNKPKPVREFPQYIYQIKINPYWEYTTPAFQTGIWHSYYYYGPLYYQLK